MSSIITTGSFTNVASTPYFLPLNQHISRFDLVNLSKLASYTSGRITNATCYDYMSNDIALVDAPTTVTGPLNASAVIRTQLAQNGFTIFNAASPTNGPVISGASFVPGQPTVFTAAAHGFKVGDIVRIYNVTSAPQLGGLTMTVTAVNTNDFTTLLDTTNALTSVFSVYKVGSSYLPSRSLYFPENRVVAKITLANPMVVTTLVAQNYAIGDVVTFQIPTAYGMQQLNAPNTGIPLEFTISAVNNAVGTQTVTFANTNSTAYTALASLAASAYPNGFPVMIPRGEGNTNNFLNGSPAPTPLPYGNQDVLSFARQNLGFNGILIGAGDGTAASSSGGLIGSTADVWLWTAFTSLQQWPAV